MNDGEIGWWLDQMEKGKEEDVMGGNAREGIYGKTAKIKGHLSGSIET